MKYYGLKQMIVVQGLWRWKVKEQTLSSFSSWKQHTGIVLLYDNRQFSSSSLLHHIRNATSEYWCQ